MILMFCLPRLGGQGSWTVLAAAIAAALGLGGHPPDGISLVMELEV